MDRDYKIGIIAGFIVIVAVLLMAENSEYKQCLQAGAEARSLESFEAADKSERNAIWMICTRKA